MNTAPQSFRASEASRALETSPRNHQSTSNKPRFVGEKSPGSTVKDLCTVDNGFAFDSKLFNTDGDGVPIIRIRDIKPGITNTYTTEVCDSRYLVNDGDMLIGMDGEFNLTKWKSGRALLNQRVCRIRSNSAELLDDYLRYFLPVALKRIEVQTACVTVKHLSSKVLNAVEIPLRPLEEQRAIVLRLDNIQQQIDIARLQLSNLDQLVKSRFVEMFGDLSPSVPVSEVCTEFVDGDWIESKDQSESGIRLIQTGNVGNGVFQGKESRARYISEQTFERLKCHEVFSGDILVSRLPDPVGRACIVPSGINRSITAVDCTIMRLKKEWEPLFVVSFTMMDDYQYQIKSYLTGTTRKRISRSNLGKIKIPAAPLSSQQEFVAFVAQVDKPRFAIQQQIEKLEMLKASLMQEYFG